MRNHDDADDVSMRPAVWSTQHDDTDIARKQRTQVILERRKDAIIDALHDPDLSASDLNLLKKQHREIKADISRVRLGAPLRVLREIERKWR
ncbi:hypothetical protein [Bifidobacterium aquikefiri]|uniref:hypothetical protein n=1 Tax=Bifidobacterium aquikefiri TaxID=1653207 RepID=UPI0039E90923